MRFIPIMVICLLLALNVHAQKSVNAFINKHKQNPHTWTMTVPGWLIRKGINQSEKYISDQDNKALFNIADNIKKLRFIVFEEQYGDISKEIDEMISQLKTKNQLEAYVSIQDQKSYIEVLVEEKKEKIKNIVLISKTDAESAIITIKTDLPISEFEKAHFSFAKKTITNL